MPLPNTLDLSIPKIITMSSPPLWIYGKHSFNTIIDLSTSNITIKLFLSFISWPSYGMPVTVLYSLPL